MAVNYDVLQQLVDDVDIDTLERVMNQGLKYVTEVKLSLAGNIRARETNVDSDIVTVKASQWLERINQLQASAQQTRTVIGVCGNTGAGKSSVINAVLDEEKLLPTNTMRACTAVVTEISYNHGPSKYAAEVQFISTSDWRDELETLFEDLLDSNGAVSSDSHNPDRQAGIAYAKLKAVDLN